MTCIAGIRYKGKVYIGGDSVGASHYNCVIRKDPKVFKVGDFVMGFTSSFRMGQLLHHSFKQSEVKLKDFDNEIYPYMCTKFINNIRKVFKDGGYSQIKDNVESGGTFLVGIHDRLFCVAGDFQVEEPYGNFIAVGCGRDFAMGSLYTSWILDLNTEPRKILRLALEAAGEYSPYVRPPFHILST